VAGGKVIEYAAAGSVMRAHQALRPAAHHRDDRPVPRISVSGRREFTAAGQTLVRSAVKIKAIAHATGQKHLRTGTP
jgi:hypothetical protein